jgi:hypothetical protein
MGWKRTPVVTSKSKVRVVHSSHPPQRRYGVEQDVL